MSSRGSASPPSSGSKTPSQRSFAEFGEVAESRHLGETFPRLSLTPAASVQSIVPSRRSTVRSSISASSSAASTSAPPPPQSELPTLNDVRDRAMASICFRASRAAESVDATKVGVIQTISSADDIDFLLNVASTMKRQLLTSSYLFIVLPSVVLPGEACPLLAFSSSQAFVEHAATIIGAKFIGRVLEKRFMHADSSGRHPRMLCFIRDLGSTSYDDAALLDVVRKAVRSPADPLIAPPGSHSVEQLVQRARARLERVSAQTAYQELRDLSAQWPVLLIDIRPEEQRKREGSIGGSIIVERNMLEWRLDPRSLYRLPGADRYDLRAILFCSDGTASSLAAASLLDLGLLNATDMIGGYRAWKAAGLPSEVEVLAHGMSIETLQSLSSISLR